MAIFVTTLVVLPVLLVLSARGSTRPRDSSAEDAELRAALERQYSMPSAAVITTGPAVPGLIVFTAYVVGRAHDNVTGVFDGQVVHPASDDSIRLVLTALGYGSKPVDPLLVAGAVGLLEGNPGSPVLTASAVDRSPYPSVTLPRTVTIDGRSVVEYWNATARRQLWRSQVFVSPDGAYEVRQGLPEGFRR